LLRAQLLEEEKQETARNKSFIMLPMCPPLVGFTIDHLSWQVLVQTD